ncbi:hypothetical protein [Cohaesibacter intestini]|uniref:hypothetical protein n=1 Tax=Cohaesibacter intestini TaxID=2211145 RepID=UPI0013005547|nr:hypothetical protein [Cohaesibacter intestini]
MQNHFDHDTLAPSASYVLAQIMSAKPQPTKLAPKDRRGIYGLVNHLGQLRHIGSTSAENESFYKRIHLRHRTGSETMSHYFSYMYNTGRMWRLRNDAETNADGLVAKKLRNAFIAQHCKAVWFAVPDTSDISGLEQQVISLAPAEATAWNGKAMQAYDEPVDLVNELIHELQLSDDEISALDRQLERFIHSA